MVCNKKIQKHTLGVINMPDMESVGSALMITFALLVVSVSIVGVSMWLLYKFFKNKDDDQ